MTATEWRPTKLDELGQVGRGRSRHRPRNADFLYGGTYPFFQTGDIKAANCYLKEYSQTYSEAGLAQSKLWQPGTLCITIAANIAESAILGIEGCFPDSVVGFVADSEKADVRFVKYYLEILKLRMQGISHGATQDNLSLDKLLSFDFLVPPIPIQRRIAGILSAYDDLIENSQRRIKILEEMARRLYREWFVHFRFPGHEGCTFVESPLGEIPEGWEVKRLGDVTTKIGSGATPKGGKGAYKTEGIHLIRSLNIYDYSFQFDNLACINEDQAAGLDNVRVQQNDVLLNITGASVARCAMVPSYLLPARVNQHVAIIRADEAKVSPHYLLDAINSDYHKQKLLSYAQGGATREALTKETISGFEIVVPPTLVMSRYAGVASVIHLNRETLTRQIQNLRRTRDLLLPRLLSGQIDGEALPEPVLTEP
jgi:type I restriction enzyme S subunit